jgi:hypothetical protein
MSVIKKTREQIKSEADAECQRILGCSFEDARKLISLGWYEGTWIAVRIAQYRWLLS